MDDQFGEALSTLSAAVRAGLSVRRALDEAHRAAGPPLKEVLARAVDRLRTGQPLEVALEELTRGVGSSDAAIVVALLDVHRRTGGDLPALLDEVGDIVEHRIEARRQIRALTAQGRASGAVLAVLPIAFVGLLSGTGGDGLGAFYRTMPGAGLLMAGLLCELLGFVWIRHIIRPEGEA
jgi:tight adherence protein B